MQTEPWSVLLKPWQHHDKQPTKQTHQRWMAPIGWIPLLSPFLFKPFLLSGRGPWKRVCPFLLQQRRDITFAIGGTGRSTSLFPGKPRRCRMCSLCFYKKLIQPLHTLSMVSCPLRTPSPGGIMFCYMAKTNYNKFSNLKQATQILFHSSVGRSPTSLTSLKINVSTETHSLPEALRMNLLPCSFRLPAEFSFLGCRIEVLSSLLIVTQDQSLLQSFLEPLCILPALDKLLEASLQSLHMTFTPQNLHLKHLSALQPLWLPFLPHPFTFFCCF